MPSVRFSPLRLHACVETFRRRYACEAGLRRLWWQHLWHAGATTASIRRSSPGRRPLRCSAATASARRLVIRIQRHLHERPSYVVVPSSQMYQADDRAQLPTRTTPAWAGSASRLAVRTSTPLTVPRRPSSSTQRTLASTRTQSLTTASSRRTTCERNGSASASRTCRRKSLIRSRRSSRDARPPVRSATTPSPPSSPSATPLSRCVFRLPLRAAADHRTGNAPSRL